MAREWIEFVQTQNLPFQADDLWGTRPGVRSKALSHDPEDGAASLLLRYPAGWRLAAGQVLAADEELLVLEGKLAVGDAVLGPRSYAHWPAGWRRGAMAATADTVVLTFFSRRPEPGPETPVDPARLVPALDAHSVPYGGNFHPQFPPGAGRKMLYQDPETGDQSWLLGTLPMRNAERAEVHPTVEEMYLLAGEVHGNRGVMRPGAYFWRPPEIPHGPYGTLTGNLYFFRTKGGALKTDYVDAAKPFAWWPDYDPVLPAGLDAARGEAPPVRAW